LAWAYLIIVLTVHGASYSGSVANLLFYANMPPFWLDCTNGLFWSLSVEVQVLCRHCGRRGWPWPARLWLVPIACLLITASRIASGVSISIVTWWRADDILAGGCLALLIGRFTLPRWAPFLLVPLLLAACHPNLAVLDYLRSYIAAILIGSTVGRDADFFQRILCGRVLGYLAEISYAPLRDPPRDGESAWPTGDTWAPLVPDLYGGGTTSSAVVTNPWQAVS